MEPVVTVGVRLGLGVFLAFVFALIGMALATFVIPPAYSGRGLYLLLRVLMIGASSGVAGALIWSPWRDLPRDMYATLLLALLGGIGGGLTSYAWVDPQFDGLGSLDAARVSDRTTIFSAIGGANLIPAFYSSLLWLRVRTR